MKTISPYHLLPQKPGNMYWTALSPFYILSLIKWPPEKNGGRRHALWSCPTVCPNRVWQRIDREQTKSDRACCFHRKGGRRKSPAWTGKQWQKKKRKDAAKDKLAIILIAAFLISTPISVLSGLLFFIGAFLPFSKTVFLHIPLYHAPIPTPCRSGVYYGKTQIDKKSTKGFLSALKALCRSSTAVISLITALIKLLSA